MHKKQQGISLIEVLIVVLIFAIGMLGITRMHIQALRYANIALHRSVVSQYFYSLSEQLRIANSANIQTQIIRWTERLRQQLPQVKTFVTLRGRDYQIRVEWCEVGQHQFEQLQYIIHGPLVL